MFVDIQRQLAVDIGASYSHENTSPNATRIQILTLPVSSPACSSVLQTQTSQPQTSQQVQDPLVLNSDTRRSKLLLSISQSSSEQDSPSVQLNVEAPSLIMNNYFSSSSDVEKDCTNTIPIPIEHCKDCKLSPEEKELPVKDKYMDICCKLKYWKKTARGFGLTEGEVHQLENDHKMYGVKECAFQSYLKWKMQNGYTDTCIITLWKIVEILHKSQEHEAIKELKRLVIEATDLSVVES